MHPMNPNPNPMIPMKAILLEIPVNPRPILGRPILLLLPAVKRRRKHRRRRAQRPPKTIRKKMRIHPRDQQMRRLQRKILSPKPNPSPQKTRIETIRRTHPRCLKSAEFVTNPQISAYSQISAFTSHCSCKQPEKQVKVVQSDLNLAILTLKGSKSFKQLLFNGI